MNMYKNRYSMPETRVIEVETGNVMDTLGMSDNKEATDIQAKENLYMNWEEEEEEVLGRDAVRW